MSRQQFKWKGTGVLEYYPPDGRPTSATVVGYSQGTSELWASDANVLDPYEDTFTNAEIDDTTLTVTDTTNAVIGRRYWIETETGGLGREVVCVDLPAGGTAFQLQSPLTVDIASGTIKGHRLSRTVTETTAIWRNSRALWTLTYPDRTVESTQKFDIVPLPLTLAGVAVTEGDLEAADTNWGLLVDTSGAWRNYVSGAFDWLWNKLERSYKPDLLRSRDMFDEAIKYCTLFIRFHNDPEKREFYRGERDDKLSDILSSTEAWYDSDDDLLRSEFGLRIVQIGDDFLTAPAGSILDDSRGSISNEGLPAGGKMMVT